MGGDVGHDDPDSGYPIKIGGKAETTAPSAVADGDRVNAWFDEYGRQVVALQDTAGADAIGEVQASPTANTLLARLKDLLTGIVLSAGSAIIGKVSIDQTTPGTTNAVQEVPAAALNHTSKTTNAGTAVQVAANTACREAMVTAKPANTGFVYIGGSTVSSSSYGRRLEAGDSLSIAVNNLNLIYIDVSVNGEGVDVLYLA